MKYSRFPLKHSHFDFLIISLSWMSSFLFSSLSCCSFLFLLFKYWKIDPCPLSPSSLQWFPLSRTHSLSASHTLFLLFSATLSLPSSVCLFLCLKPLISCCHICSPCIPAPPTSAMSPCFLPVTHSLLFLVFQPSLRLKIDHIERL